MLTSVRHVLRVTDAGHDAVEPAETDDRPLHAGSLPSGGGRTAHEHASRNEVLEVSLRGEESLPVRQVV
jgi:hypothetical protein